MKYTYPFDPLLKHHIYIALGLAVWIFLFLYATEPIDVGELSDYEKVLYLPIYAVIATLTYLCLIPIQNMLYNNNKQQWTYTYEFVFLIAFAAIAMIFSRLLYLYVIVYEQPNPYSLWYYITSIFIPAFIVILPVLCIGRLAFGKYHNKQLNHQKIEIKGEGNYEGLRIQLNDVVSIQSSNNYVEIFYVVHNELKKTLIRNKLSVIDKEFKELLRTHRSYLINPFHFQQWKTKNGKHFLILNYNIEVPISKTYLEPIKASLNSTTN